MEPRFLTEYVTRITRYVTEPTDNLIADWTDQLISKNHEKGKSRIGFYLRGEKFVKSVYSSPDNIRRDLFPPISDNMPAYDLIPEADELFEAKKKLERDKRIIGQNLTVLLQKTKTTQDVRDALPEELASFGDIKSLYERTREEAYTLKNEPLKYKAWFQAKELIIVHLANRMFM